MRTTTLLLSTQTLFTTSPINDLDPRLIVVSQTGQLIAIDDDSAPDGRNAMVSFIAPEAGV